MTPRLNRRTLIRREKQIKKNSSRNRRAREAQAPAAAPTPDEAAEKGQRHAAAAGAFAGALSLTAKARGASPGADAFQTVENTKTFMFNLLQGVGICFIAFGVLSLAISMQSHDDSQKSKAIMAIVGGAIAVSVKLVVNLITGTTA